MGTRCLTHIKEGDVTLVTVYRQFDGYPDGHGIELAYFLTSRTLVNGIDVNEGGSPVNGAGDLAAQFITVFKSALANDRLTGMAGSLYIEPPDAIGCGEDFTYTVRVPTIAEIDAGDTAINVTVTRAGSDHPIFTGAAEELEGWTKRWLDAES